MPLACLPSSLSQGPVSPAHQKLWLHSRTAPSETTARPEAETHMDKGNYPVQLCLTGDEDNVVTLTPGGAPTAVKSFV